MSTEEALSLSTAPRGVADFDSAVLREVLDRLPLGEVVATRHLQDYLAYYRLGFPGLPHVHEMFCLAGAGERLVVQFFLPERMRGHVLFFHGYYDHVGLFTHTIEYFLGQGLAVVAYDQIGHGLSSGAPATIDSFDRYVEATRVVFDEARVRLGGQQRWHWAGQSMGGAIIMEYLEQYPESHHETGEIVLLAPLVRPHAWWINRWVFALARRTIKERPRTLTENAENPEFHALQKVDPLQARVLPVAWVQAMVDWYKRFQQYPVSALAPILLQGDSDRTVDWKYGLKVYTRRYPHHRSCIIPDGRHHLANEAPEKRAQMWVYLDEHCRW